MNYRLQTNYGFDREGRPMFGDAEQDLFVWWSDFRTGGLADAAIATIIPIPVRLWLR
jgi:hypothetical protein